MKRLWLIALILAACSSDSATTVRFQVNYDDSLGLDQLEFGAGGTFDGARAGHEVVVRVPDAMGGQSTLFLVAGVKTGQVLVRGEVTVRPVAGHEVTAQVSLVLDCSDGCTCTAGEPCADSDPCTVNTTCQGGTSCGGGNIKTCNEPDPAVCLDASTLRTFAAVGSCTAGACGYEPIDTVCANGCSAGRCNDTASVWSYVGAGNDFSCGVRDDRTLACWGNLSRTGQPPAGSFEVLESSTDGGACARNTANEVTCWGAVPAAPTVPFVVYSVGSGFGCGAKEVGQEVQCWGLNNSGAASPPSGPFTALSAGRTLTCGVRATNFSITCWGDNSTEQLPAPPSGIFYMVALGATHACALRDNATVACWGSDSHGESSPPADHFLLVATGRNFSCGLTAQSEIKCWGDPASGATTPPSGAFNSITARDGHACAVREDKTAVCWGEGSDGQLNVPQ